MAKEWYDQKEEAGESNGRKRLSDQEYKNSFSDVRWFKKRREAYLDHKGICSKCKGDLELVGWECHHRYYESGTQAFDYPTYSLEPCCKSPCHAILDEERVIYQKLFSKIPLDLFPRIIGYAAAEVVINGTDKDYQSLLPQVLQDNLFFHTGWRDRMLKRKPNGKSSKHPCILCHCRRILNEDGICSFCTGQKLPK